MSKKNKIRILGALTHFKLRKDHITGKEVVRHGAVDFYRIVLPLKNLPKDRFDVEIDYDYKKKYGGFENVTKNFDILFMSYVDTVQVYLELRVNGIKNGMKMAMDLDDNLWNVDPTHPYYKGDFEPGSEKNFNRSAMLLDVDAVTTTNSFLRYKVVENVKRPINDITILPNCIDLNLFDYKKIPPKNTDEIVIGYIGGSSHFQDINKPEFTRALSIIMDKYPQVRLKTTFFMPQLKALYGWKYRYTLGRHDVYRYIRETWPAMASECSIFVAPLSWSPYSRAKSYIKACEYGASKVPMVLEKIDPYIEFAGMSPQERGVTLASSTEDWVSALSKLIESEELRKDMGEKAYEYVKAEHTAQNPKNVKKWVDFFEKLYAQPGKTL